MFINVKYLYVGCIESICYLSFVTITSRLMLRPSPVSAFTVRKIHTTSKQNNVLQNTDFLYVWNKQQTFK